MSPGSCWSPMTVTEPAVKTAISAHGKSPHKKRGGERLHIYLSSRVAVTPQASAHSRSALCNAHGAVTNHAARAAVHAAVQAALRVLASTAQRSASAADALAAEPGGATLEAVASEWVAEASALRAGEGVLCWPVGSSSGAAVLMLARESDSSFAVTFCGGEGVEYHPQVSLYERLNLSLCFCVDAQLHIDANRTRA